MTSREPGAYRKFRLKPEDELLPLIRVHKRLLLLSCSYCFTPLTEPTGDTATEFLRLMGADRKRVTTHLDLSFLCNQARLAAALENIDLRSFDAIGVIACGIGIQLVASLAEHHTVYALADSVPQGRNATCEVAYHGMSLEPETCAACGQCYLNSTAGICPVVACAKSLVNGPCGGARDGKCEVDPRMDCAWVTIYERLQARGAAQDASSARVRDHSLPALALGQTLRRQNIATREAGFAGGLALPGHKEQTSDSPIESLPEPPVLSIFLQQHAGRRARPVVAVGDRVRVGQVIGAADGYVSAAVHSSVSGTVTAIEERPHPTMATNDLAVVIRNDFTSEPDTSISPRPDYAELPRELLLQLLQERGVVGFGGAMFPTHVKLCPPKPVDTLIINGCECEPFLNTDNRLMMERTDDIIQGTMIALSIAEVGRAIIAVEDNKPEAIRRLRESTLRPPSIEVAVLGTKYPQGAEGLLIRRLLDRQVPRGALPFDVGVTVINVATAFAIQQAIMRGIPLFERVITVAGDDVARPGNYWAKIGTPVQDILVHCLGNRADEILQSYDVKMGGPMMGLPQTVLGSAVIKGSSGFTVVRRPVVERLIENDCIKCGRCVDACPAGLEPLFYGLALRLGRPADAEQFDVMRCIECGCCDYVCPQRIPLVSAVRQEKAYACRTV